MIRHLSGTAPHERSRLVVICHHKASVQLFNKLVMHDDDSLQAAVALPAVGALAETRKANEDVSQLLKPSLDMYLHA